MRYLMIVTYDGKNYSGFQKQNNANSIQSQLESAIKTITKKEVSCIASGRTDAKVSAFFQPVHFDIEKTLNTSKFQHSINGILPKNISVLSVRESTLHARFDAKRKTYLYKMYVSSVKQPLLNDALQISPTLIFKEMNKFLKLIVGTHDFAGFKASGSNTETSVRTIYKAKLTKQGQYLYFTITGNGFLYKMVRNIVGTMLKIGEGKIDLKALKQTIFTTYKSTFTARPEHLYLLNVEY